MLHADWRQRTMHIVTGKYLKEAADRYPDAAKQLIAWRSLVKQSQWRSPDDLKVTFADAEFVGDYVILPFSPHGYRLVTTIHYSRQQDGRVAEGHVWMRSFLTLKQFENTANW